jgi:putative flippase GtrA
MDTVFSDHRPVVCQLLRYEIVSCILNLVLYLIYWIRTGLGIGPKLAMTPLYSGGVLHTFVVNRQWSFRDDGAEGPTRFR